MLSFFNCEDDSDFALSGDGNPEPYLFSIGEDAPSNIQDKGSIAIIAVAGDGTEITRPSIYVTGSLYSNERVATTYSSLTINGVLLPPTTVADQEGVNPAGKIFSQFFDSESGTPPTDYNKIHSLFTGQEVSLDLESSSFGSLSKKISTPVLRNVMLNATPGYAQTRRISSNDGLVLTWDTDDAVNVKSLLPQEEVAIALVYYAEETIREQEQLPDGVPMSYPTESQVYSVVTENDGEHTIDPQYLQGFPGGGIHRIIMANGVRYNFDINDTDNTIQVTTGTFITSDEFEIEHCDGLIVFDTDCL